MMDYAAPVVELIEGSEKNYQLNIEELEKILANKEIIGKKVVLISIAGAFRKGKSFLLNFLVTYLEYLSDGKEGPWFDENTTLDKFHWRGGSNRDTSGIFLWSKPYILKNGKGDEVVVLLMDTQGTFDHRSTVNDCATIFAMSILLSSLQIFNVSGQIQEDDLNNLQLFTEYAQLAIQENEDGQIPFQTLIFCVRDWQNSWEHPYGYTGGQSYLSQVLKVSADQKPETQNLRKNIRKGFERLLAFLMPHPGLRIAQIQSELVFGRAEQAFEDYLHVFVPSLFGKGPEAKTLEAKTINCKEITCGELLEMFKAYIKIFNGDQLPEPKTILQATADAVNFAAERRARSEYDSLMMKNMDNNPNLANLDTLNDLHSSAHRAALKIFADRPRLGDGEAAKASQANLRKHFQDRLEDYTRLVCENIRIEEEKKRLEEEEKRIKEEQERERQRVREEEKRIKEEQKREKQRIKEEEDRLTKEIEEEEKKRARELEEKNKRLKEIYEDEGMEYDGDATYETIGDKIRAAHSLRKNRIKEAFKSIRQARAVQLCFLVDATGSMQGHIDGVRNSINDIVKQLTNSKGQGRNQEMSLAFVAYRDHCDSDRFEILPFTKSTEEFKRFCEGITATGGGDGPEDVFGGIDKAINLGWSSNISTKVIFHICDAPCHGREFHCYGDDYPDGDPHGLSHTELFSRICQLGIHYYFGQMNSTTDQMIRKFSDVYGQPIVDFDVKKASQIRDTVVTAVGISRLAITASSKKALVGARVPREYTLVKADPDWMKCPVQAGTFSSYEFPERIQDIVYDIPLKHKERQPASVKIASNPFDVGVERYAFLGRDITNGKNESIVLKEYRYKEAKSPAIGRYDLFCQMQTTAAFLAKEFIKALKNVGVSKNLEFLEIRTLSLPGRYLSVEKRFASTEKFVRFTNNADYEITETTAAEMGIPIDSIQLVTAFSHWTYKATNRFLMVVDLEGMVTPTGVLLTDPAIHCQETTRYAPMNLGNDGMAEFFLHHECNYYCNHLDLKDYIADTSA